jgi:DNA-binding GntR family transcriptional regulator
LSADGSGSCSGPDIYAAPRVRSAGPTERDRQGKILHVLIQSGRKLSRDELVKLTGLTTNELKRPLQRVVADGRVLAEGATKARRFRIPKQGDEVGFHSDVRERQATTARRNATKVTDAVARVGLRDRVMKAILADPDALTEDQLARALDADRDDIAEACGWLLQRHRVQLNPDGTYRRAAGREAA